MDYFENFNLINFMHFQTLQVGLLYTLLTVHVLSDFSKTNLSVNKVVNINEGKVAIFGVSAKTNPSKHFNYTISINGTKSGDITANIGTTCSTSNSWDSDKVEKLSDFSCKVKKGDQACSKTGIIDGSTSQSACLVVYCYNSTIGGSNCSASLLLDLTDKLSVKLSTKAIPYLYPTVRVEGTGFGANISMYKTDCTSGAGKALGCKVKTVVDSENLDISITSMLSFVNAGPISINVVYGNQNSKLVQVGVAQFGSIFNYTKWIILFGIIIGLIIYFVNKRNKKAKEKESSKRLKENDTQVLRVNQPVPMVSRSTQPVRIQLAQPADSSNQPSSFY